MLLIITLLIILQSYKKNPKNIRIDFFPLPTCNMINKTDKTMKQTWMSFFFSLEQWKESMHEYRELQVSFLMQRPSA